MEAGVPPTARHTRVKRFGESSAGVASGVGVESVSRGGADVSALVAGICQQLYPARVDVDEVGVRAGGQRL